MPGIAIEKLILNELWDILTLDETLAGLMGGTVNLYLEQAPPDSPFPYMVHRIELRNITDYSPERQGTYLVDLWSNSPNADEVLSICDRVDELIHNAEFETLELDEVWLWRQAETPVPDEPGIRHRNLQFNIRYLRLADAANILRR